MFSNLRVIICEMNYDGFIYDYLGIIYIGLNIFLKLG